MYALDYTESERDVYGLGEYTPSKHTKKKLGVTVFNMAAFIILYAAGGVHGHRKFIYKTLVHIAHDEKNNRFGNYLIGLLCVVETGVCTTAQDTRTQ